MTSAFNLGWLNFSILLRSSDLDLFSPFFPSDLQIGLGQNELLYGIIWVERRRSQTKKRSWHYYRHNHNLKLWDNDKQALRDNKHKHIHKKR